ncbi:hypothetical protein CMV30_13475 [Nibricoccus aquaticus]|uniref:DUF11 domain-containing protein n=1 Tax=Nibricoccus aquaticus TaxID=2576891 RepID=A0A290Q849_9BACT|nr:hypothetical protein [Nibricoccus aquaticus]ATC64895.1 hypothetical protein CMV30_13475 [Nibricoccus aquaticus]
MNILLSSLSGSLQADYSALPVTSGASSRRSCARALFLAVAVFLGSTAELSAAQKNDLEIALSAQRVNKVDASQESLDDDDNVAPGDVVQYRAVYRNQSDHALRNLAPTLPIPAGTEYVDGSAYPAPVEGSLDGKTFESFPIRRSVKTPDGRSLLVAVPVSAYRALRWKAAELPAAATFVTTARVQIVAQ